MSPACLYHSCLAIGKPGDGLAQEIRPRQKIGIEDSHKLPAGLLQPVGQGPGFKATASGPPDMFDSKALLLIAPDQAGRQVVGFVRAVVQYLYLQFVSRIIEPANGCNKPFDYILFIINRQLHGYGRPLSRWRWRLLWLLTALAHIKPGKMQLPQAIQEQQPCCQKIDANDQIFIPGHAYKFLKMVYKILYPARILPFTVPDTLE